MKGVPGRESGVGRDQGVLGMQTASLTAGIARGVYGSIVTRETYAAEGRNTCGQLWASGENVREWGPRPKVRRVANQGAGRRDNSNKSSTHGRYTRVGVDLSATAGPQYQSCTKRVASCHGDRSRPRERTTRRFLFPVFFFFNLHCSNVNRCCLYR